MFTLKHLDGIETIEFSDILEERTLLRVRQQLLRIFQLSSSPQIDYDLFNAGSRENPVLF